ncbi:MAG: hypothetical protein K9W45_04255 [Candidatus Heimdallarchaeum aukensis]|uniref:Uncharacterized protein n=1 Tax=Candidatus Heimdallarchaeum aukensis TaxID=2876573 RepID=A0A9Y1FM46_9ARCH|nr:MAG: hypothetical protein K9W45_04255 [Candidatus Heimdallarchaeum aukensis]
MTVQTFVLSPKILDDNSENSTLIMYRSKILVSLLISLRKNGILLKPEGFSLPIKSKTLSLIPIEERLIIEEMLSNMQNNRRIIEIKIEGKKKKDECIAYCEIQSRENPDWIILPYNNCRNKCEIGKLSSSYVSEELITEIDFYNKIQNTSLNLAELNNLTEVHSRFIKKIFRFAKEVMIVDRYLGVNLVNNKRHYKTLNWLVKQFEKENIRNGNFIICTTTPKANRYNPQSTKKNIMDWLGLYSNSSIHIEVRHYNFCSSLDNDIKFPHERVLHTDQFNFKIDYGFEFIMDDDTGKPTLKEKEGILVDFYDKWKSVTLKRLRELDDPEIFTNKTSYCSN